MKPISHLTIDITPFYFILLAGVEGEVVLYSVDLRKTSLCKQPYSPQNYWHCENVVVRKDESKLHSKITWKGGCFLRNISDCKASVLQYCCNKGSKWCMLFVVQLWCCSVLCSFPGFTESPLGDVPLWLLPLGHSHATTWWVRCCYLLAGKNTLLSLFRFSTIKTARRRISRAGAAENSKGRSCGIKSSGDFLGRSSN